MPLSQALAAGWLVVLVLLAMGAGWMPLPSPSDMDLLAGASTPSGAHWLGTDAFGRDLLARVLYGGRTSLSIGLGAATVGLLLGGALGLAAGSLRGRTEAAVVVLTDSLLAFPGLVLAMLVTAYLGRSVPNILVALGVLTIPAFARVARANATAIAGREYVLAARALGVSRGRIVIRHILPNVWPALATLWVLAIAVTIVLEGALSFIGLGLAPPAPSWGGMIAEGREYLEEYPHISLVPAAALFLTVLSVNRLGEALRSPGMGRPLRVRAAIHRITSWRR